MGIDGEGRAIGMIGGQEDAPGIADQEEELEADGPLQGIDEILVAIAEGHQAAAAVAFDIHADPLLRMGQHMIAVLRHGVAGSGDGLAEHDLADVQADMGIGVDRLGDAGGPGGEMPVALGAIAVELHMGEMEG